ncbi:MULTISPECIES: PLP-dependent aminotransferase family protein [unclassified Paludibacterium]|uniref:aminotransferase-like domain-containing protein n=1 Tax=unclassified Paludibacterium TaxID=2618429 RepID=UPI001C05C52E|nr:PLP-dependent aminotransferase family protein [Paludibacterium sp. B53371]BEV72323.1 PLP-dependent aminotransferase family protein [Paludibacterium sp. THUN1379]
MSKYRELVEHLIHSIERGDYLPGELIPSLRHSEQHFNVSLNTVRRAYEELERLGYIEARPRSGYVVARGAAGMQDLLAAPLGAPFINPQLHDTRALTRAFFHAMRHYQQGLAEPALAGLPALRRQLARLAHGEGWSLHADEILVTCGGMEALSLAISAVTLGQHEPGVAVLLPAFPGLLGRLNEQGVRIWPMTLLPDGLPDLAAIEPALSQGKIQAIALMSVYGHPHGQTLGPAARQAILQLAQQHDIAIIEDDAYRWLGFHATTPVPLQAMDQSGRVLLCSTFSKTLTPGYRLGWLVPGRYGEICRRLKLAQTLSSPLPNQMALAELLAQGRHKGMLAQLTDRLAQQVRAVEGLLHDRLPFGRFSPAQGGYFVWLRDLPVDSSHLTVQAQRHGIQLAAGWLCQPDEVGRHALRINASYYDPAQQAAFDWLLQALAQPDLRASAAVPLR